MKVECPNCKSKISKGYLCNNCGINTVLFTKTVKISNNFYNKGLAQAKELNLWGAADYLNKSIDFNKNNYKARNLLGLVYYETGKLGDALKQWIISASIMKNNNLAATYIDIIQKDQKELYRINEAIIMYNQALLYMKQKSDDMAIIQLKKSIEINPNIIDSLNLLTFCYLIQNEKEKAQELIYKVLKIDTGNLIALNYQFELTGKQGLKVQQKKAEPLTRAGYNKPTTKTTTYSANRYSKTSDGFTNNFNVMQIVIFLVGALCTFIFMYILIIPGMTSQRDITIAELESTLATIEQLHEESVLEFEQTILQLQEKNEELMGINTSLNSQFLVQEKIEALEEATALFNAGNAEAAADILYEIDISMLPEDISTEAGDLKERAFASAGLSLYNRGLREFNAGNFQEAKGLFERSLRYAPEGAAYVDDAIYFMGRIAQEEGNTDLAITYFRTVIEDHPNSNMLNNATGRLNALESG